MKCWQKGHDSRNLDENIRRKRMSNNFKERIVIAKAYMAVLSEVEQEYPNLYKLICEKPNTEVIREIVYLFNKSQWAPKGDVG